VSDKGVSTGDLGSAVLEYEWLQAKAKAAGESFDESGTLQALAEKTGLALDVLQTAVSPLPPVYDRTWDLR
jgi:hypothetical protein